LKDKQKHGVTSPPSPGIHPFQLTQQFTGLAVMWLSFALHLYLHARLLALSALVLHVGFCWHGPDTRYQSKDWGTERHGSSTAVRWDYWLLYSCSGEELWSRVSRRCVQWRASSSSIREELFIAGELLPQNVEWFKHWTTDYFTRFDSDVLL